MDKMNMSSTCGFKYEEYWRKTHMDQTMSQEDLDNYIDENCAKCRYMSDICMYGEDE